MKKLILLIILIIILIALVWYGKQKPSGDCVAVVVKKTNPITQKLEGFSDPCEIPNYYYWSGLKILHPAYKLFN